MRKITTLLLTACLLCACGQKGNLYLPDNQPEAIPAAPAADATSAPADDSDANATRNRRSN